MKLQTRSVRFFFIVLTAGNFLLGCAAKPYRSKVGFPDLKSITTTLEIEVAHYDSLDPTLRPVDKKEAAEKYRKMLPIIHQSIKDDLSNNLFSAVDSDGHARVVVRVNKMFTSNADPALIDFSSPRSAESQMITGLIVVLLRALVLGPFGVPITSEFYVADVELSILDKNGLLISRYDAKIKKKGQVGYYYGHHLEIKALRLALEEIKTKIIQDKFSILSQMDNMGKSITIK